MKEVWKGTIIVLIFVIFTACSGDPADRLITKNGVGKLTFEQAVPDMGKGYTTGLAYDDGYEYYAVKDKAGKLVANAYGGSSIEVFSPKFKTMAGVHPGMNLHKAAEISGEKNLFIWIRWPEDRFTIADATTEFAWHVDSSYFIPGKEKFDEVAESGKWSDLTLGDFTSDAIIRSITVFFSYDDED